MMILATNWGNAALMALVSIMLVFVVLVLLIVVLKLFGVIFAKKETATTAAAASSDEITDEEVAAIAVAVNLFFNRHDEESDVLTFRQNHDVSAWQVRNISKQL
ncbi:MAG: hypothetical protein IKW42_05475 [Alistipes sp.]|nr:hypothetical protein [Alistipes sp.]